jgi:hypothetical protein
MPLPVIDPALVTVPKLGSAKLTGSEVNVTLAAGTAQQLFATQTLVVSALIQRATANTTGLLIGYMALPDLDQPLSLPPVAGCIYDLAQVVVKGTMGANVNVKYFTY